jgi:putative hydrolase of the HAD superfamily
LVESAGIDLVLFDLGGVLVDFGGVDPMRTLANIDSDHELWRRWLSCPWVRTFERGHCSAEEFARGLVAEWQLAISPGAFLEAFGSWPGAPMPGADELLSEVRRSIPAGCLSNTNVLHWESHFAQWPILGRFDMRYLSFELGMVKPDAELFEVVAQSVAAPTERVLFLDDNLTNVEAAVRAGFTARQVRGVEEARLELTAAGVVE